MVTPVTGPFSDTFSVGKGGGSRWWTRQIYRQAKPYDLPLPYSRDDRGVDVDTHWGQSTSGNETASSFGTRSPMRYGDLSGWFIANCDSIARERLMNQINSDQLLYAALAEARGNIRTIANRLDDARYLISALRPKNWWRLRHSGLYKAEINGKTKISVKGVGKEFADATLEVYFGLKPIMSDIDSAAKTLSHDFSPRSVRASGAQADQKFTKNITNPVSLWYQKDEQWQLRVKCGCQAEVTNPNLYLAQSLGLINPFATVWELLPWSFVVDYFFNVGAFIGSLTDTYGLKLSRQYTRRVMKSYSTYTDRNYVLVDAKPLLKGQHVTGIWYRGTRANTSLPDVNLHAKAFSLGKDLNRVKTSLALLIQALTR